MKPNYTKTPTHKLRERLQSNKVEIAKTYAVMGMAVMKNKTKVGAGDSTSGLRKNLRKDTARILTELNRRKNE